MLPMALSQTAMRPHPGVPTAAAGPVPTVFIVDGDPAARAWLGALVRGEGWEARTFASGAAFLDCAPVAGPGCLVLDVRLPDIDGLELQALVACRETPVQVVFLTSCAETPMAVRAMKAGAAEFLIKPVPEETLLDAIGDAVERSRDRAGRQAELQALRALYGTLTARERQVMTLVVMGLMNKQIAFELGITECTVKVHRGRLMDKMRARSLAQLVQTGGRLGLCAAAPRLSAPAGRSPNG